MGEVSLELIVELLKDLQTRVSALDARMSALEARMDVHERLILDLHREVAEVKSDVRALSSDNMAFRGYFDALIRDNNRNISMIDRTRQDLAELRARVERVEARPGPVV